MKSQKPVGAILYRAGKGEAADVVYAVAKWRDSTGRQCYRRLGRAWVELDGAGSGWRRRRGRLPDGYLDRRAAERAMDVAADVGKPANVATGDAVIVVPAGVGME